MREAAAQLPGLALEHLGAEPARIFAGPRRLAVLVDELPVETADEWIKGPPVALRERAAEGFARRHGLAAGDLVERDGFLWARIAGQAMADVLPERLDAILRGISFNTSMRWDESGVRFARPVRWLCGKLDGETVAGEGSSYGHRFTSGRVEIPSPAAYADALRSAGVEPDAGERERLIREGLDALGEWRDPAGVLAEVVHLVEWPIVLEGRFDERFLELPEAVVTTAMQSHQRYFPLGANRFAFVANGGEPATVVAGNERVLEGRLDDASFTLRRDLELGIERLAERLGAITYLAGAGTFAEKAERLRGLVRQLGGDETALEAARLAKADQAAELVREFPELEGTIGAEYARRAGRPEEVCLAIAEHHLPDSAGGPLPSSPAGRLVSAADKVDALNVAFERGLKPTGSRDPFGLRRAAIGVLRLALDGGVDVPRGLLAPDVQAFVEERLEGLLDVPVEFVRAARAADVASLGAVADLARTLASLDGARLDRLHTVFTRAHRIVVKSEAEAAGSVDEELLEEPAEREVHTVASRAAEVLAGDVADEEAVAAVEELEEPLERFFDEVLVMAPDERVRANRLALLRGVRDTVSVRLGDLSQLAR